MDQGYHIWTLVRTITVTNYNIKYKYIYVICFELRQRVLFKSELTVFYIYRPMLNIGADVYNFGQSHIENETS
jgi:hypothetical protein